MIKKTIGSDVVKSIKWDINKYIKKAIGQIFNISNQVQQKDGSLYYAFYGTEYAGAAHGMAGILYALLKHDDLLSADQQRAVKITFGKLVGVLTDDGLYPRYLNIKRNDYPFYWCHGAPGFVYTLMEAYKVYQDETILQIAKKVTAQVYDYGILTKSNGLCHGISGNGYTLLHMYLETGDEMYLEQAKIFAMHAVSRTVRNVHPIPDNPYGLYEGLAGVICFISDILYTNPESGLPGYRYPAK